MLMQFDMVKLVQYLSEGKLILFIVENTNDLELSYVRRMPECLFPSSKILLPWLMPILK